MLNKEKIIEILMDNLYYCYCDNCEFSNEKYEEEQHCYYCHRKYMEWSLSTITAEKIADQIMHEFDEFINEFNKNGCTSFVLTQKEIEEILKKCQNK